jgi:hypothetical protein
VLDIKLIREKPDFVRQRLDTRGVVDEAKIDELLQFDEQRRKILAEVESLKSQRNRVSKEIGALFSCMALTLAIALIGSDDSWASNVIVPGTANPWLAGSPDGTTASEGGCDIAPDESPVLFTNFTGGMALQFSATGSAGYESGDESGPDGVPGYFVSDPPENGIGALNNGLANELLGVFLDDATPDSTNATPDPLDFSADGLQDATVLLPALNQPFAIGNGFTTNGAQKTVLAPVSATRLFLGVCDGFGGWYNNTGQFSVDITQGQNPLVWLAPASTNIVLHWPAVYTNLVVQANTNLATTNWVNVTNASIRSGKDLTVTIPIIAGTRFFRLFSP